MINIEQEQDTITVYADMQFGVDYYKGKDGITPIKGKDYFPDKEIDDIVNQISVEITGFDTLTNSDVLSIWNNY